MTPTPTKKHSRPRGLVLSRTKCRALRRRGQQSLRYWKFITHFFSSQHRHSCRSLFTFFKRMRTALGALAFAFLLPTVAQAETFTVTTASDISAADDGQLTLREAIHSANDSPGPDTIDFAKELSGAVLTLAQGELVVSDDLAIDASGLAEAPIIDADQKSRLINVTAPEGDLALIGLTLRNGMASEDDSGHAYGGGILFDSSGELTITNSIVSGKFTSPVDPANNLRVSYSLIENSSRARLDEAKLNLHNIIDVAPLLAPLADNGGPTWTMLPLPGYPVINAGAMSDHTTDQRGFAHIGATDIGAVEHQGSSDLFRLFDTDFDHDGNSYLMEQALGTDPFRNDPNNPITFSGYSSIRKAKRP